MRKVLIGTTAAMAITANGAAAFQPESTDPIRVMIGDWTSMLVHAEILDIILSTYGYNVEQVAAEDSARYPGFEAGDLHIALETWQTTQEANLAASIATGNVARHGRIGAAGQGRLVVSRLHGRTLPGPAGLGGAARLRGESISSPRDGTAMVVIWAARYHGAGSMPNGSRRWVCPFEVVHAGTRRRDVRRAAIGL